MSYSFKDIAKQTVNEGDFCLFRSGSGLEFGMFCGRSFIDDKGRLNNFSRAYKLSNTLNPYEQKKKIDIQNAYNKYYADKETKKKVPAIKAKDLEIGQAYTSINGDIYIYLGHGSLTETSNNKDKEVDTGFIYIRAGYCNFKDYNNVNITSLYIKKYLLTDMFLTQNMKESIDVLKTRKKLIAKVDYKSPIIKKNFNYYYSDKYRTYSYRNVINKIIFEFQLD